MKTVSKFECGYCHSLFDTEEQCTNCEKNHHMPKKMVSVLFTENELNHPNAVDNTYPLIINIQMDDGKTIKYELDHTERRTKAEKEFNDMLKSNPLGDIFDTAFKKAAKK